jgi:5'-3' exonuclease
MGIPSYFHQIIKRHKHIVSPYTNTQIDNLYFDSNSIVYDAIQSLEKGPKHTYDSQIISYVCNKLLEYIAFRVIWKSCQNRHFMPTI